MLLNLADTPGVDLEPQLRAEIAGGFGDSGNGEDRFAAAVGLLGLLIIVLGRRPGGDPTKPAIRRI